MESADDLRNRVTALEHELALVQNRFNQDRRTTQMTQNQGTLVQFSDLFDQFEQRKITNVYSLEMGSTPADYFDLTITFGKGVNPTKTTTLINKMYHDISIYLSIGDDEKVKEKALRSHLEKKLEKRFKRARSRRTEVQVDEDNRRNRRNSRKNRIRDRRLAIYKKNESNLAAINPLFGGLGTILSRKEIHSDYESDDEPTVDETRERGAIHRKSPSYRSLQFTELIDALENEVQRGQRLIRSGNQPLVVLQEKTIVINDIPKDSNGDNLLLDWMYQSSVNQVSIPRRDSIDSLIADVQLPEEEQVV